MADEDSFFHRWSRRKQEARLGREPAEDTQAAAQEDDARPEVPVDQRPTPPAPTERPVSLESLPDIASLGAESDFRPFMQPGVPPELRTQALRRLWRVKAKVGNPERLLDYDEDYTDAARVVKGLKTLYRVGRGVLTDAEVAASEAERARAVAEAQGDAAAPAMAAETATAPSDAEPDAAAEDATRPAPASSDSTG